MTDSHLRRRTPHNAWALRDGWTVRAVRGSVPPAVVRAGSIAATVPGSVHTDLLAAGLIPDPYLDDHERLLAWIGLSDWRYETTFEWIPDGHERQELVFDGLDTVAEISLNGVTLGQTANMHRTYRFDVSGLLLSGANELAVVFTSAVRHADAVSLALGGRPHVNAHPFNAIRKMACNFGWDWGPELVTAGLWRPVWLRSWSRSRLASVRPVTIMDGPAADGAVGRVQVHVAVDPSVEDLLLTVSLGDAPAVTRTLAAGEAGAVVTLEVPAVRLWWPRGLGDQPLYDLAVRLAPPKDPEQPLDPDQPLDEWHGRIGFRTVVLDQTASADGTGFAFLVNARRIYVKGANWIPDDVFPHRVTRQRLATRLDQAEEAGINLLRVWGGGAYESDEFYAECDERGLMVWQDFPFCCAAYPEEEPLASEVVAEARDNVTRLMPHPSLVLWNGNNENLQGFAEWRWQERLDGQTWGHGYYHDILPRIVAELDPGRAYTPGSPWSGPSARAELSPNDPSSGTVHIWDVWNDVDYLAYRGYRPRFVAEFGWQGPPAWATLRRALSDDPLTPESPGMLVHQKAVDGNIKLTAGLLPHFRLPSTMDDWHWAMSLNQARAIRIGVEYFRSLRPHCGGTIVWQLNDCWPVVSWSAIDGDGRRKPMFYALAHAHADRLVTVQPALDGTGLRVALANDTGSAWSGLLAVSRRTFDGVEVAKASVDVSVGAWSTVDIPVPAAVGSPEDVAGELVVASLDGRRGLWWFAEDRDSALPSPSFSGVVDAVEGGYRVTVTADVLLRDLSLLADRVDPDAVVEDMLVTLLPGESVTWMVRCATVVQPSSFLDPLVMRSANQLTGAVRQREP